MEQWWQYLTPHVLHFSNYVSLFDIGICFGNIQYIKDIICLPRFSRCRFVPHYIRNFRRVNSFDIFFNIVGYFLVGCNFLNSMFNFFNNICPLSAFTATVSLKKVGRSRSVKSSSSLDAARSVRQFLPAQIHQPPHLS